MPAPESRVAVEPMPDDGPVLIQVEYRIEADNREAFLRAISTIETTAAATARAVGAYSAISGEDGRFVERFMVTSWAEYMRLRPA